MHSLAVNGYTHDEIRKALHTNRKIGYRFELQDKYGHRLGDVTATGSMNQCSDMSITRSATLTIKEINEINVIDERIQPFFRLFYNGEWIEYPLGVFLISSPTVEHDGYVRSRQCECNDKSVVLIEDKFDSRYIIAEGTSYTTAITTILSNTGFSEIRIQSSPLATQTAIEFEIGTSKLDAVNSLLDGISYNRLHFDEKGVPTAEPFIEYSLRAIEDRYATDDTSIIGVPAKRTLDTFNFPNKIIRYTNNPDIGCLKSMYENVNPESRLSITSRQRKIVDIASVSDIADATTLDAYVRKIANEKSLYEIVEYNTAIMPHHSFNDCLGLTIPEIDVSGKYIEKSWTINFEIGGYMTHTCKRVVDL